MDKKKYLSLILLAFVVFGSLVIGCNDKSNTRVITNKDNNVQANNKNEQKQAKNKDMKLYKGYKGPVQGEIKYQEGRPAKSNSKELKASGDIESPYHINLVVTKDFGYNKMFSKNVGLVKDEVGMEVLFRNLNIQTAYGGGFVNSINGLESKYTFFSGADRKKQDWFYWVNGILAPIGVAEYKPSNGDVIWWDYHQWKTTMFIPAIIGSYPEPFKHGFGGKNPGTAIMYTKGFKKQAEKLKDSLLKKGVKSIDVISYSANSIEKLEKYHILVGTWDELSKDSKKLKDINWKNKLSGVYAEFKDGKLNGLDSEGKVVKSYDNGGVIYAASAGMGSTIPLWVVTGIDEKSVKESVDILLNHAEKIKNCFGVIVKDNDIVKIPFI